MSTTVTEFAAQCGCNICAEHAASSGSSDSSSSSTTVTDYTALLSYLENDAFRWNGLTDLGTPVIVTYSFTEAIDLKAPSEVSYSPETVETLTTAQRDNFRDAFAIYEATAGVKFIEVEGTSMINIFGAHELDGAAAYANLPQSYDFATTSGDLVMGIYGEATQAENDWDEGTYGFLTVLHEIGHAMGLDHPFEGPFVLDPSLDNRTNTVMTYDQTGTIPTTLQGFDVSALQNIYGGAYDFTGWAFNYSSVNQSIDISGTSGNDVMLGPSGLTMTVDGMAGNDTIIGREGDETLSGGGGHDEIFGFNGVDRVRGQGGRDTIDGGGGGDKLFAGNGDDVVLGGIGNDTIRGGKGNDTLNGGEWSDTVKGDDGNDLIIDPGGLDELYGGVGEDTIYGGTNYDTLNGGNGSDFLYAGEDGALLEGGSGRDVLTGSGVRDDYYGGKGVDTFVFNGGGDWVYDFEVGESAEIDFDAIGIDAMTRANLDATKTVYSNAIEFTLTATDSIVFFGNDGSQLQGILDAFDLALS